jgi:hypothetical protein
MRWVRAALALLFGLLLVGCAVSAGELELPEKWRVGNLGVYIFSFPYPKTEMVNQTVVQSPSTITGDLVISLAVWGVSSDEPVEIRLDGRVIRSITRPGYYVVTERVVGSHHVAVMCRYKVFEEAGFYAVPPPPPPPTIPLAEFLRRLKEEKQTIILYMSLAAATGVPAGIWTKKKTKIKTDWVYPLPAALFFLGYQYMPDYYMLIPFSLSYTLSYALCRDYADFIGLFWLREGLGYMKFKKMHIDDDGMAILGISPRYWRRGFMLKKDLVLENVEPYVYRHEGEIIPNCFFVKKYQEEEDRIEIEGDPGLARLLVKAGIVEKMNQDYRKIIEENVSLKSAQVWMAHRMTRRALKKFFRSLEEHGFEVKEVE